MKRHLTITELALLGFEVVKTYLHDEWTTQRRRKGNLIVETTWVSKSGESYTQDLWIEQDEPIDGFTLDDLKLIDKIFNK